MSLIRGVRVELESPYPRNEIGLVYEWLHSTAELTEDDDSPATLAEYEGVMGLELMRCTSYGIRRAGTDRLIGLFYCEPSGRRNGYLHIAMDPSSWGRGLADEAAELAIRDLFERFGELTRLSVAILENNRAAQALTLRMGFRLEAALPDMVVQGGTPRSLMHYGLTRREFEQRQAIGRLEVLTDGRKRWDGQSVR